MCRNIMKRMIFAFLASMSFALTAVAGANACGNGPWFLTLEEYSDFCSSLFLAGYGFFVIGVFLLITFPGAARKRR